MWLQADCGCSDDGCLLMSFLPSFLSGRCSACNHHTGHVTKFSELHLGWVGVCPLHSLLLSLEGTPSTTQQNQALGNGTAAGEKGPGCLICHIELLPATTWGSRVSKKQTSFFLNSHGEFWPLCWSSLALTPTHSVVEVGRESRHLWHHGNYSQDAAKTSLAGTVDHGDHQAAPGPLTWACAFSPRQ